ncbi:hypothetical protein N836_22415 [Leptolyngbya sp. Heron Island J]|nr:hypothetical protein N836_22415 [Leptolyngbya sp. Heron Island J]
MHGFFLNSSKKLMANLSQKDRFHNQCGDEGTAHTANDQPHKAWHETGGIR